MDWSKHQWHGTHALTLYFMKNGFQKCLYELSSYVKSNLQGDILIMCLYVDDLITTANNLKLITEFKEMMISQFEITNMGLMSYFLGFWVIK